jgi:hypothetical protein
MTCPYLKEVSMVFCRAYPVKKPVPIDRVTTASTCEAEAFKECPLFREALARAGKSIEDTKSQEATNPAATKGVTS